MPDRSVESLAQWLKQQPTVEIVARDRAGLYAEGASKGAPDAVQVADRFYLLCNLTGATERALQQKQFTGLTKSPPEASPTLGSKEERKRVFEKLRDRFRQTESECSTARMQPI